MNELSPEARALFHAARRAGAPPADAQARIRDALRAKVARPVASASTASVAVKYLAVVVLAIAATWGAARSISHRPSQRLITPPTPPTAPAPPRVIALTPTPPRAVNTPAASSAPLVVAARPARVRVHAPRPIAARTPLALASSAVVASPESQPRISTAAPSSLGVAEEVRLVSAARGALRGHDGARALNVLDEHQRRFPSGVLAHEASAVRVLALCALGRTDEARTLARAWFVTAGPSPLAANLRRSCAGDAL